MTRAFTLRRLLLFVTFITLAVPTACDDPKTVDSCGDDFVDPDEDCDGAQLNGATCTSIGHYDADGTLRCTAGCAFDVSDCGGHCGDDLIEGKHGEECEGTNLNGASCASLNFSRGGTLACDTDCRYDYTQCLSTCGDGNREPDEGCDDANGATGDGCTPDCTVEPGWTCTTDTHSVCTPACPEGLTWCGEGDCADLFNNPERCGGCDHACDAGLSCIAGVCRTPEAAWNDAGRFPGSYHEIRDVQNFDLESCPGGPILFYKYQVHDPEQDLFSSHLRVLQLGESIQAWSEKPELIAEVPENQSLNPGMAVTCRGTQPVVAYTVSNGAGPSPEIVLRVLDPETFSWPPLASSTLPTSCWEARWIDLSTDAAGDLHVMNMGHWYSNHVVEYAWWNGLEWQASPSVDATPRAVAHPGIARQSLTLIEGRAVLGVGAFDNEASSSSHRVQRWEGDRWTTSPVFDLDPLGPAPREDISVAGNGLAVCAAWIEDVDPNQDAEAVDHRLFVRCSDALDGAWLPDNTYAMVSLDHQARSPSLLMGGEYVYLAYLAREVYEQTEYRWRVRVLRRPIDAPTEWQVVGSGLDNYPENDNQPPQLIRHGHRLYLAYLMQDLEPDLPSDPATLLVLTP